MTTGRAAPEAAADLGSVLVVGGTGMLRATTCAIAHRATALTLIARSPEALAADLSATCPTTPIALDLTAEGAVARIAQIKGGFDTAVIWLHDDAVSLSRPLEDLLRPSARLLRVMGSLAMDPAVRATRAPDPRQDITRQLVILGWHPDAAAPDGQRWLSHAEINAGVLAALNAPALEALIIGGSGG
ncbi:hypothetical protein [Pararhodobacter oceanensis]|uniref:Short-chain dehydrogenase n=1 Tax=Pararhodobacter oceanensis TaxID=2172121 RepID=A0A2T8HRV4_9RHOB|nr:hypothetical protein [Pararhodobacter oceanensis]PVH28145.1 hypothetical protein DDE20_13600 [Pararhodobacter oceanensis]